MTMTDTTTAPVDVSTALDIDAAIFRDLARVTVAAGTDQSRPVLTAVRVRRVNSVLTLVATDSYRLARATLENVGPDLEMLIPAKLIKDAGIASKKVAPKRGGWSRVSIAVDGLAVTITAAGSAGTSTLTADLVTGTYPAVDQLIPETATATENVAFNPSFMADAAQIMPACSKDPSAAIRIMLGGDTKPSLFRAWCGEHGVALEYLLMPVRIS